MEKVKEKIMPANINEFWTIPSLIDKGKERSFSDYLVHSKTGNVWSCKNGRYLKPSPCTGDYRQVGMMDDNSKPYTRGQHRFTLSAMIGNWDFEEAGHADSVRYNNRPYNLFATTRDGQFDEVTRHNMSKAKKGMRSNSSYFTDDQVRDIRNRFSSWKGKQTQFCKVVGAEFNTSYMTIYYLIKGQTYADVV